MIGDYGITFGMRAAFIYTTLTNIEGFFIRKMNWLHLINKHTSIANILKKNVMINYLTKIRGKIIVHKRKAVVQI